MQTDENNVNHVDLNKIIPPNLIMVSDESSKTINTPINRKF